MTIIDPTLPPEEFIGQAVGAASVCWSDMAGQGISESERAAQIANEITAYMYKKIENERNMMIERFSKMH